MRVDKGRIIYDLIEPNRRQYSIPVYQRNYDWSKDQCLKLFEEMAETNERDRFIMFSYNKKTFRSSKSLNDTGIYYNTNLSAPDKIYFVRTLLDTYGIDRSDFLYSAKYY